MKKKTLWWLIGGGICLVLLLIIFGRSNGDDGIKVAVETAGPHTITETVTGSGKIYPETQVKIAPEVSGEIITLNVKEGDSVHRGEVLVRINGAIYNSVVNQYEASVSQTRAASENSAQMVGQAKSQYELALATYNRNQKLFQDKIISAVEMEQAKAQYEGAKAAYEASRASSSGGHYGVMGAQASLSQARENLRKTTIIAPTTGIISQLNVKLGERVVGTAQMAGTELLTIADMSRLEVRVDVSETDIAKVKIGDTTIIEADAYRNRKFKGIVSRIDVSSGTAGSVLQASSDQVTNYTVRIFILPSSYADLTAGLPRGKFVFKPGMSASVEIQTRRERNILSVPVNAVTTREWPDSVKKKHKESDDESTNLRQLVFIYDSTKKTVAMKDVTTGIQDNLYIQINGGLKGGERVVTAPYGAITRLLKEGSRVRPVKKEDLFEEKKEE